jgi:hypothetical protein
MNSETFLKKVFLAAGGSGKREGKVVWGGVGISANLTH